MKKHAIFIWIAAAALMLLAGCSSGSGKEQVTDGEDMDQKYDKRPLGWCDTPEVFCVRVNMMPQR